MFACLCTVVASGPTSYPFNDVTLATDERVKDLISRMTLKEKVGMLFMSGKMAW